MKYPCSGKIRAVCSLVIWLCACGMALAGAVPGAVFTTNASGTADLNVFNARSNVYLWGCAPCPGGSGLVQGHYYVKVTDPTGSEVLGSSLLAPEVAQRKPVKVGANGCFTSKYHLSELVYSPTTQEPGYDETPDAAGEYVVWISQHQDFPSCVSLTDRFVVYPSESVPETALLKVVKFYDTDTDGCWDPGEYLLPCWKICITNTLGLERFTPVKAVLPPGTYLVSEQMPFECNWKPTTRTCQLVTLESGCEEYLVFGNVCLGKGGAHGMAEWTSNAGAQYFGPTQLKLMQQLSLRQENGKPFDPTSPTAFGTWLRASAQAHNISYLLSAYLAIVSLDVSNTFVRPDARVYAPCTCSANDAGFATVHELLREVNNELSRHDTTYKGYPWYGYQIMLLTALKNASNNTTFVQPHPCTYTFCSP
jgi:hypothetical protein